MVSLRHLIVLLLTIFCVESIARADSWAPAKIETYLSADKQSRLTVTPRELTSNLAYFQDKVDGKEHSGQRESGNAKARGLLERKDPSGKWTKVWEKPLINDVSPVSALVANGGKYVVTFDNWHSTGYGNDAVVIYDEKGSLIRSFALTDIVSESYFNAMPRSASSIQWSGDHKLTSREDQLALQIVVPVAQPKENDYSRNDGYLDLYIYLETGKLIPPSGADWERANQAVKTVNAFQLASEQERRRYLTDPLLGPASYEEGELHSYLREAFSRLTSNWQEDSASTTVLRLPAAKDYAPSEKWVRDALLEDWADNVSIASQSADHLLVVLRKVVSPIKQNRLKDVTVYLMAADSQWPDMQQIFAKSGAKLVQLNPEKPIPQSPDRLAKLLDIEDLRPSPAVLTTEY